VICDQSRADGIYTGAPRKFRLKSIDRTFGIIECRRSKDTWQAQAYMK
jgi:hypothetical protein